MQPAFALSELQSRPRWQSGSYGRAGLSPSKTDKHHLETGSRQMDGTVDGLAG